MIERLRGAWAAGSVGVASVVLLAGCAAGQAGVEPSSGNVDGASDLADDGFASEIEGSEVDADFGEPPPEVATEEAPAEVRIDATSIEVATLPIGGNAAYAGEDLQCVDVGWSDPPEIPTGVTVVIEGLVLEPAGHFVLSDQRCPGDVPPCLPDHDVTPERRCTVAVGWTAAAGDRGGALAAAGSIACAADADRCSAFTDAVRERGGASIELRPPLTAATPSGNDEGEGSSGSSGRDGEPAEDSAGSGTEGTPDDVRDDAEPPGDEASEDARDDAAEHDEVAPENGEG